VAEFDFDAARRWVRFDPHKTFARRGDDQLPFITANLIAGQGLLLDTCVYIDQMQNRSPPILDDLITQRQVNHSTVAIQELMHTVGVLNPSDRRTAGVVAEIGKQSRFRSIASSRCLSVNSAHDTSKRRLPERYGFHGGQTWRITGLCWI
jgi:hypothetical protein